MIVGGFGGVLSIAWVAVGILIVLICVSLETMSASPGSDTALPYSSYWSPKFCAIRLRRRRGGRDERDP